MGLRFQVWVKASFAGDDDVRGAANRSGLLAPDRLVGFELGNELFAPAHLPREVAADDIGRAAALRLNCVIFQVRPACDALYVSQIEPRSEYLTGKMGRAPKPAWDPLAFAISEAHRQGMELHAWFNPYRARYKGAKSAVATNHISRTQPALVKAYNGFQWLDPAEAGARKILQT